VHAGVALRLGAMAALPLRSPKQAHAPHERGVEDAA
jgi:hypothetical protein